MMGERSKRDGRRRLDATARQKMLDRIAAAGGRQRPAVSEAATEGDPATKALRAAVIGRNAAQLPNLHDPWNGLPMLALDEERLERNLIIAATRRDPAHAAFDVLRTRLLHALQDNGWTRVAVTAPGRGCGTSFTALNLAIAFSRYENCRTLLLDFDLRRPGLAAALGVAAPGPIADWLRGETPLEQRLRRIGRGPAGSGGLAVALNDKAESYSAELLRDPKTAQRLDELQEALTPDVVLFDLPPALAHDDVAAFRDRFDAALMVVGGGQSTAEQIREAVRRMGENKPLLGVVLNRAETDKASGTV